MSPQRRTLLALTAASTAMLFALSGCSASGSQNDSASASPDGPVTISFWHEMAGPAATKLDDLVAQFNSAEAGKITVESSFQGTYADAQTKYTASVQSNSTPDIIMMNDVSTGFMVDSKMTTPLSTFTDKDSSFDEDSFPPVVSQYYAAASGGLAAMPFAVSQPVLYLNRTLVTQAGLDPDKPPATLGEVADWAEKIHSTTGAYGMTMNMADSWMLEELSAAGGEDFCTPDNGRGSDKVTGIDMTTPTQLTFISRLKELFAGGVALNPGTDSSAMNSAFSSDKVGMMLSSSGAYTTVDPNKTASAVSAFPKTSTSSDAGVVIGGNALWISGEGHSDAQQQASYELLKYLHTAEVQAAWASATGYLASNTGAAETEVGKQSLSDPNVAAMSDQLLNTPATQASAGCRTGAFPTLRATVIGAFNQVIEGAEVESTMKDAEDKAADQIAAYNTAAG